MELVFLRGDLIIDFYFFHLLLLLMIKGGAIFAHGLNANKVWVEMRWIDSDNSSAGRAEDCRVSRLSFGRWFNSSLSEFLSSLFVNLNSLQN